MALRTTINVHVDILNLINRAALRLGKTRNEIIVLLLEWVMLDRRNMPRSGVCTAYQGDDPGNYFIMHVQFSEREFDYFGDMRRLFRLSLSLILALAVLAHLEEIIGSDDGKPKRDKYLYQDYSVVRKQQGKVISWQVKWG